LLTRRHSTLLIGLRAARGRVFFKLGSQGNMPAKLTALIPCKNERRNIRPCIESVRGIADEILIADSGSTDGTLDVVRDVGGCRIIEREYVNSADFKNWAIPQAQHDWILLVDADERIPDKLADEVRAVLAAPPRDVDGYWIGRCNHYLGYPIRHCGWNTDDVIRLFRRDESRYETRWVHAEVDLPQNRVKRLKTPLSHFTTWNTDEYLLKLNRYATWGAMNLRDETKQRSRLAIFLRLPTRFLQLYVLRLGFLDGIPGLQVCMFTAFYSFLKQAKLWEMQFAVPQPDPESERLTQASGETATIDFAEAKRSREQAAQPRRYRRAA
jgi:glycosyltransferase involved in cell wall biosynthesis